MPHTEIEKDSQAFREALFRRHLKTKHYGKSLLLFDTLASTNTEGKSRLLAGVENGTVLIAETQTAGRGRLDRRFFSPVGSGIYLTVCLRPKIAVEALPLLTPLAGVAAVRAIQSACGISVGIKWVNDIVCNGKKLAGILSESILQPNSQAPLAVIGIGINVKRQVFPDALAGLAGSLAELTANEPSRERLAAAFLNELEPLIEGFDPKAFLPAYRQHSVLIGKTVTVLRDTPILARVTGIGDRAELCLTAEDGTRLTLSAGEVSVREK